MTASTCGPLQGDSDGARVNRLAASLAAGRTDEAGALFRENDARSPLILWRPGLLDVQHPVLRSFVRACRAIETGTVPETWIESEEFAALAGWAMVVEALPDKADFVYRHYGSEIAATYGADMNGRRVSDIGGHVSVFFRALYLAAMQRREPVKSVHEPPLQVFVRAWRRVIVPLHDRTGAVRRLAAVNVADNELRAGLDVLPDPVLVVDADGVICFANRAACLFFDHPRGPAPGMLARDFLRCDLTLPECPDRLILEGGHRTQSTRMARGGMVTPLKLTVGATYYRDRPFYVLSARVAAPDA